MKIESEKYTKLIADGFCVFEQVLEETMLASEYEQPVIACWTLNQRNISQPRSQPGA